MQNDFFYFSKGQRRAVLALIAMIGILLSISSLAGEKSPEPVPENTDNHKQEIKLFLQQLGTDNTPNEKESGKPKKQPATKTTKRTNSQKALHKDTTYQIESVPRISE